MERLLAATIDAALAAGVTKPASLTRVTIDTTVQPKAIAFPTDSRLYHRGREVLVRLAVRHGVKLRQSYHRLSKRALRRANRYAHAADAPGAARDQAAEDLSRPCRATLAATSPTALGLRRTCRAAGAGHASARATEDRSRQAL